MIKMEHEEQLTILFSIFELKLHLLNKLFEITYYLNRFFGYKYMCNLNILKSIMNWFIFYATLTP